ncbi:MAG: hypothetical protein ACRDHI_02345 [Actinomycetota bacterium]
MTAARVELVGSSPSGLSEVVAGLFEQQLRRDPGRAARLVRSVVVLEVPDAGVATTVRLAPGLVRIVDGAAPDAPLRVRADSGVLLALANVPLRHGLPDPSRPAGRAAIADVVTGRVRVRGLARHPRMLAGFLWLLSVHEERAASSSETSRSDRRGLPS